MFAGCCSILQTGDITLSSTPEQQLENHSRDAGEKGLWSSCKVGIFKEISLTNNTVN